MTKPKIKKVALLDESTNKVDRMCQYGGKLGTVPALFTFRKNYILSKGLRVEFTDRYSRSQMLSTKWQTGIVDDFHAWCIFISRL